MDIKKEKRAHAEVALSGVIPAADIERCWKRAVTLAVGEVALPGFRKGHVPEARVIEEMGERSIWREAAEMALKEKLEDILKQEEVVPVAPLALSLKPTEKGKDVAFTILAVVAPSVTLGDYAAIAKRALESLALGDTEKEHAEAKKAFRTQAKGIARMSSPNPEALKDADADVPLLDDEAKMLGFETASAFELFIEGEAHKAVADRVTQKKRGAVADALIAAHPADIPTMLIRDEATALVESTKRDIAARGMQWSDYLKHNKKTEEQMLVDLMPVSEKRITLDLVFSEIVKKENIKLEGDADKKAEDDLAHAVANQGVDHERAHAYARESLLRERVWEILGIQSGTKAS